MGDDEGGFGDGLVACCEAELVEDAEPTGEGWGGGESGGDGCKLLEGGYLG